MSTFIQITFSGLATGAIFALAAVGFALLWQTAGAINFAHGEFIVLPAVIMVILGEDQPVIGLPTWVVVTTGVGDEFVQELQYMGLPVQPYVFTALSKRQLVELIAIALDKAHETKLTLPDEPILLNELEAFDMKALPSGNIRYAAPEGQHDDAVMSYGLGLYGAARFGDLGITIGGIN